MERSLLPWAIFLIFTRNRPWKSEDHLCTLFFIEMSKERLEKSERTPPVSWRPWVLAYSRDRPYNFSCLSAVSKNRRFSSFFSALGCHLAKKSFWWPAIPVRADLLQAYEVDLPEAEHLDAELRVWKTKWSSVPSEMKVPSTVEDTLKSVSGQELLFPNVLQVLKLLLVTPGTTASVEARAC